MPALFGIALSLAIASLCALLVWDGRYPKIYVDNASDHAMQIWMDGAPLTSVPPNLDGFHAAATRISRGKHRLGYSAVGAPGPEEEVDAEVIENGEHLYNPGAFGCYWRHVALYQAESGPGPEHHERAPVSQDGPLAIQRFYEFPHIQYWFENPPEHEKFSNTSPGMWRVALLRNPGCTDLAKRGCPLAVREGLVSCQAGAGSKADLDKCLARAHAACDASGSGR